MARSSTHSAIQFTVDLFNDPKGSDEQKATVVANLRMYWRSIEDEIRKFVAEKWTAWEQEKPKWFHKDMLPERVLAERRRCGRRRSSKAELLLGVKEEESEPSEVTT